MGEVQLNYGKSDAVFRYHILGIKDVRRYSGFDNSTRHKLWGSAIKLETEMKSK